MKTKVKTSGRSAQAEEDLDAILAEVDGLKPEKTIQQVQGPTQPLAEGADVAERLDAVEPAAASKRKRRVREKQKVGKQAEPLQEVVQRSKISAKALRQIQERLAKQREAEESIRRMEEERRQREEEEQRWLEESERQKEDAKAKRKAREKEKLLKKKQAGKLLTGKQKEKAKMLALFREKLLAPKGSVDNGTKYENMKTRQLHGGELNTLGDRMVLLTSGYFPMDSEKTVERDPVPDAETACEVDKERRASEAEADTETEEEDEDWDAKSWDNDNIGLPPVKSVFAEEEEGVSTLKKEKSMVSQSPCIAKGPALPLPQRSDTRSTASLPSTIKHESEESSEGQNKVNTKGENSEQKWHQQKGVMKGATEVPTKRSGAVDLRSPICCILGHVDAGKTKLLDCIGRSNVQEGEAGGITQQIGATLFPRENILERTKDMKTKVMMSVPGLLVIDTPGHEFFANLRSRGSGLCDIAILVVDIMHGLELQTLEALHLLKMRRTPFVVALNKVDRLYGWKTCPNAPIQHAFEQQSRDVLNEFERHLSEIVTQLKEQGLNSELYYNNPDRRKYVSIVPTSAMNGEGVPDLLTLLITLTQQMMERKLLYVSEVQCTVLEVNVVEGLGTTIDVILVNGVLHEGDQLVVCGMQGPIVTNVRALLTPHPMKELRSKGQYLYHKELKAAQGIKITAQGLEHAIAGTQLHVVGLNDELEAVKAEAMQDIGNVMSCEAKSGEGVYVQASTLGSLEALVEFLKGPAIIRIHVCGKSLGPVHKRDVMRASVMLERKKEYSTILAFDVKITSEAKELAEELGVRIFTADVIYHLLDQFTAYINNIKEEKRKGSADEAVFPCVLRIRPQSIFNKKDPMVLGVDVVEGTARVGTPICVPSKGMIDIGRIASMENNRKVLDVAKKGQAVAVKIVGSASEEMQRIYGRHFDHRDELVSHITRRSIDALKESFRDDLSLDEWKLVAKLKKLFNIP